MRFAHCLTAWLALVAMCQPSPAQSVHVPTLPAKANYYPWITYLSQGPTHWIESRDENKTQGRAYRVVVLTSDIYNTVYFEEVALGREGCCKKVLQVRKFDLEAFASKYGLKGELAGFEFARWLGPTSFVFTFGDRGFVVSELNKQYVRVQPQ